jgi:hypothetical protein
LVNWRKPARKALVWAGSGIIILLVGLLIDRFYVVPSYIIWISIVIGLASVIAGAIILLNAVAPGRKP